MKELVSVIITCYNHEKYIEQCLRSVYEQSYQNIELLVINDGSTDHSGEIIQKKLKDSPFDKTEYIAQENQGVCITRNRGLEWATGDFLLFVDSDNYLDEDYIEQLLKTAIKEDADIVYTDLVDVDTGEVFMSAEEFDLTSFLANNYIDNCSLIRRSKIGDVEYDLVLNRKKLVDYDFFMNLILNSSAKPVKCSKTKLNYRVLQDSVSRVNSHGSDKYYYEVYLYILGKYVSAYPGKIFAAIENNIFTLENRLSDLIQHLQKVTKVIQDKEDVIDRLMQEIELEREKTTQLSIDNKCLENMKNELLLEKEAILFSKSYRLGNLVISPLKKISHFLKNKDYRKVINKRIKRGFVRKSRVIMSTPKKMLLSVMRCVSRKKNNYTNPKRFLIYVIYEDSDFLKKYKVIFLEALSKIVDCVLVVVNGSLKSEDIEKLRQYGKVKVRGNDGYDTAAFRYGIDYVKNELGKYDELLLVNDTNVGPISNLEDIFFNMACRKLDFWGITYGEPQTDFTNYNRYGTIPIHLQSYFLVIEKSLLTYKGFYQYWEELGDTNSREKAIGKHETVFTKYFSDLGFKHGALVEDNTDSPMYIHPLKMVKEGVPFVKYAAFGNYTDDKFAWQGLKRNTEIPELIKYIQEETNYPMDVINEIVAEHKGKKVNQHILIIDGVENVIPQLTKYRVENKIEQLEKAGFDVWHVNLSDFQMGYAENASHIIIYRAPYTNKLADLVELAHKYNKIILYDIDDLVIDTLYTNQLNYVQNLSKSEKLNYDIGVMNYGKMLRMCDGVVTSTSKLKEELKNYMDLVLLNRNVVNDKLIQISKENIRESNSVKNVRIGYFSGSITHNENFELIKPAILNLLEKYSNVELHIVGHLEVHKVFSEFKHRVVVHPFVDWKKLPELISQVDINLAPLVGSVFNQAKSEIKWLEAALVKVPTIASNIGAFKEMILDGDTGILCDDLDWFIKLEQLVLDNDLRDRISESAYRFVMNHCTTESGDELIEYLRRGRIQ